MTTTTNLGVSLVDASQAQKEVTINQAFTCFDAMLGSSVADKDLTAPPGSPVAGVVYIVGAGASGAWTGHAKALAYFDQVWRFVTPQSGMRVWVRDESQYYQYDGSLWQPAGGGTGGGGGPQAQLAVFSPTLGTGLKGWWDLNDYKSLTFTSGKISAMADKSGQANHAAQSTALIRPIWSATAFNGIAPGASFTACDLVVTDASSIQNIFVGGGNIVLTFTVAGDATSGVLLVKSTDGAVTSGYKLDHYGTGSFKLRFTVGASTTAGVYESPVLQYNMPYVLELSYNTSSLATPPVMRLNGVQRTVTTVTAPVGTAATDASANLIIGNLTDGGANNFNGEFGQIALFNGSNTATFLTQLRAYFGALSGIPTVPVYPACGQSNMQGYAPANATAYSYTPTNAVNTVPLIWDGNRFAPLSAGNNNQGLNAASFGPEISFGAQQTGLLGQSAYIVKYAVGGTNLAVNWASPSGGQWTTMVSTMSAAMYALADGGKIPLINAFLWMQGEADAQNSTYAAAYQTNLANFISQVASTAFASYALSPNYTFIIAGVGSLDIGSYPYVTTVTTAQQTVGASAGNTYIDTKDLGSIGDNVHFNAAGQISLGERFATATSYQFMRYISNFSIGNPAAAGGAGGSIAIGPSQITNGVNYYDGTKITSNGNLTYDGATLSVPKAVFTTNSSTGFVVGPNGATNPTLQVDGSVASAATGMRVLAQAAGFGAKIQAASPNVDENFFLYPKGSGNVYLDTVSTSGSVILRNNGTSTVTVGQGRVTIAVPTLGTASTVRFSFAGAADTALTASTEAPSVYFNSSQTRQHSTGAITLQRDFRISGSTHSAVGASTITDAAAFSVDGACIAGTNATITNSHAVYIPGSAVTSGVTNSYGLTVTANTGATNNYAAKLSGVVIFGGATPGIAAGSGAGTSPTIAIAGSNKGGTITLTTGSSPTASAVVATVTYSAPAPVGSAVVLTPGNAATAALSGTSAPFATGATSNFTFTAGSAALAASTAYIWHYHAVQY